MKHITCFSQGSVVEAGVAICCKYHFRHLALITEREVGAKERDIVLRRFFCTLVQASASTLGLVSSRSSQFGTLSPAENPQRFPLLPLLHLAQLTKSGPSGTKSTEVVRIPSLLSGRESFCRVHLQQLR